MKFPKNVIPAKYNVFGEWETLKFKIVKDRKSIKS